MLVVTSCGKKTSVAEAADKIESIADEVQSLANDLESTTDPEKMQSLKDRSEAIMKKSQALEDEYPFISCSSDGELSVKDSKMDDLTDEEREDKGKLDEAMDKLNKAYLKLLEKSAKEVQKTVDSMEDSSSDNPFGLPAEEEGSEEF